MRAIEAWFAAAIVGFVAFFLGAGVFYYHYGVTVLRFPMIVGVLVAALAALQVAAVLSGKRAPAASSGATAREVVPAALWLIALLPAVWLLGYPAGIVLYLLAYLRAHGESWRLSLIVAACGLAVVWGLFVALFGVRLPLLPLGIG